jgi:uncharacterized protein
MTSASPQDTDPSRGPTLKHGIAVEGSLLLLALGLALPFGLTPWLDLTWSWSVLGQGLLATVPLVALFIGLLQLPYSWLKELTQLTRRLLLPMFRTTGVWGIAILSLIAGIGEELLFRGVVQLGLTGWIGDVGALVVASVMFGVAHFITPAYFVLATVMGAYLGGLYFWTGNLLLPILVHALYDFLALGYYYVREPYAPDLA